MTEQKYTIAEGYELPSGGAIYDKRVDPHVELRSMTARDEMKRTNPSTTPFKVLADIIENCIIGEKPAVHVYDMALGDYEFLLYKLRIITYGPDYKMVVQCPSCGERVETIANLDNLKNIEFDTEAFEVARCFTLPVSGKLISLKFQTPRMIDEHESKVREIKRRVKEAEIDFDQFVTLKQIIDTVDGTKFSENDLENFINKLPARDMMFIFKKLDALNNCIGVDNNMVVECTACGEDILTYFRLGPEFFRPTTI